MKRILSLVAWLALTHIAVAQTPTTTRLCYSSTGTVPCPLVSATNKLPVDATFSGSVSVGATAQAALPSLSPGAQAFYESLSGGLFVQPIWGTNIVGLAAGLPVQPGTGTTWAATQSGTWTVQPGNTANSTPWLFTINQGGNSATVSAGGALKVDGTGGTFPVSGTVAATQSGNWTTRVVGNAGATLDATVGAGTAPTNMLAVGGIYNSTEPSPSTGQSLVLQLDSKGRQRHVLMDAAGNTRGANVNASNQLSVSVDGGSGGTVTANQGTSPWIVAGGGTAGSAASGVVTVQGVTSMTPVQVSQATAANLNATVVGTGTFAVQAAQSGNWNSRTQDGSGNAITSTASALDINIKSGNPTTIAVTQSTSPWVTRLNTTPTIANGSGVVSAPSSESGAGVSPSATQSAASNSVLKSGAGNLYTLTVTIGATAGWVMLFDATALPSNGATGASLKWCYPVNSDGTKGGIDKNWDKPLVFATGITAGFSSTACNSLTASATAFFYGQVQ